MNKLFLAALLVILVLVLMRRRRRGCRRCLGSRPCALCTCTNMN